jgi:cell division transport system permease protein
MLGLTASAAERRLLKEGRRAGPMPWVLAIMMLLTVLAAGAGLALGGAITRLDSGLQGKLTVQVPEPSATIREAQVERIVGELKGLAPVSAATPVPEERLVSLLEPWLGADTLEADLPLPALIDVELRRATPEDVTLVTETVRAAVPNARVDADARWLTPLTGLLKSLRWLAIAVVAAMAAATAAIVVLAARASLNTHRDTIEVMHLLGASDGQVAALFQRRIALDALFGGALGLAVALAAILLIGQRMREIGSALLGDAALGWGGWLILALLPLAGALLATLTARVTVLTALRKTL